MRRYTSDSELKNIFQLIKNIAAQMKDAQRIAARLFLRDLSAQYRQTYLGIMWLLIVPLTNTAIWLFLYKNNIIITSETTIPYGVFIFIGTMLWSIFSDAMVAPLQNIIASKPMLIRLNFPRESIIIAGVYHTCVNAAIKVMLIILILLFFNIPLSTTLLLVPAGIISLIMLGTTIGLVLVPVGLLYGDVARAVPLASQVLMYLTPIIYPLSSTTGQKLIINSNPLVPVFESLRSWLTGSQSFLLSEFLVVNIVCFVVLILGWIILRIAMPIVIERMGA
jgi:lipopolysaccharide transport system permease protein